MNSEEILRNKINSRFPSLTICGEYDSVYRRFEVVCNICGTKKYMHASFVDKQKYPCKECYIKSSTKTHEQFIEEISNRFPNIIVIGTYTNNKAKIRFRCVIDNYEWEVSPNALRGCPRCSNRVGLSGDEMSVELKNSGVQVVSLCESRVPITTKTKFKCLECNHIWDGTYVYVKKYGCPECRRKRSYSKLSTKVLIDPINTHSDYLAALELVKSNLYPLEEFRTFSGKILHMCKIHNIVCKTSPRTVLSGSECYLCRNEKISDSKRIPRDEYIERLSKKNPSIKLIGEYKSLRIPSEHLCTICGLVWKVDPNNLLNEEGCPHCASSKGEKSITSVLDKYSIQYFRQYRFPDCKNKRSLPFDFYIPSENLLIEYQGEHHYRPVSYSQEDTIAEKRYKQRLRNDEIKRQYCLNQEIELLYIPYWEFKNIEAILCEKLDCLKDSAISECV